MKVKLFFFVWNLKKKCLINGNNFGMGEYNIYKWLNCEGNKLYIYIEIKYLNWFVFFLSYLYNI